jgi:hypothetical protein
VCDVSIESDDFVKLEICQLSVSKIQEYDVVHRSMESNMFASVCIIGVR